MRYAASMPRRARSSARRADRMSTPSPPGNAHAPLYTAGDRCSDSVTANSCTDCSPSRPGSCIGFPPGAGIDAGPHAMTITTINPATGRDIARHGAQTEREIDALLAASSQAFRHWRRTTFAVRTARLTAMGKCLRERSGELARLIATEMGKPLRQGEAEVEKCAWVCEHYAEHGEALLAPQTVPSDAERSEVVFRPLGPVLAIMPWNFPLWQFFRFAAPALMAGNVSLLRKAGNVAGTALAIEALVRDACVPDDVVRVAWVDKQQVGGIIADQRVAAVTLTGSVSAGRAVASAAGGAV